jgi:hypothetical protein
MGKTPFQIPSKRPSQGSSNTVPSQSQQGFHTGKNNPFSQANSNQSQPNKEVPHSTINFDYPQNQVDTRQASIQNQTYSNQSGAFATPSAGRSQSQFSLAQKQFTGRPQPTNSKPQKSSDNNKKGFLSGVFSTLIFNPAYAIMGMTLVLSIAGVGVGLTAAQNPDLRLAFQNVATDQAQASQEVSTADVTFGGPGDGDGVTNTFVEPEEVPYQPPRVVEDESTQVLYDQVCGLNISYPRLTGESEITYDGYPVEVEGFVGGYKFSNQGGELLVFCGRGDSFSTDLRASLGQFEERSIDREGFCLVSALSFDSCNVPTEIASYASTEDEGFMVYEFVFEELTYVMTENRGETQKLASVELQIEAITKPNFGDRQVEVID